MTRGYSVTYKEQQVVKSVTQLSKDEEIDIHFHDGKVQAKIIEIHEGGEK